MVYQKMDDWRNMGIKSIIKEQLKSMSHKKTTSGKTPCNFAILSHVKSSDFRFITWLLLGGTVAKKCSVKKVFLEISQNSQENTSARATFFFRSEPCNFIKKENQAQVFSFEFCFVLFWILVSFIACS